MLLASAAMDNVAIAISTIINADMADTSMVDDALRVLPL